MSARPELGGLAALVTGGASGIGAATARSLLARGAKVAVVDRDVAAAREGALVLEADVADDAAVRTAVERAATELGGIDVLLNVAGVGAAGDVAANDDDEWRRVLDVNVIGIARVTRAALPHLRRSDHAAVVNVSSAVAVVGVPRRALYSASKGAVLSLTLAMAADHAGEGIRVNAVVPGTTDTPWVARLLAQAGDPVAERAALASRQPIGRLVTADEVAEAIVYLASPRSGSTTGTALAVDGGMTSLRMPT